MLPKNRQKQPVRKHLQQGHQGYIVQQCRTIREREIAREGKRDRQQIAIRRGLEVRAREPGQHLSAASFRNFATNKMAQWAEQ